MMFSEIVCLIGGLIIAGTILIASVVVPITWYEGHAKSRWLREHCDIELPWYEAAFIPIEPVKQTDGTN